MKKTLRSKLILLLSLAAAVCILLCSCDLITDDSGTKYSGNVLSVHFLDVGQGDSTFIEMPDSRTMLIDAGENMHGESIINYITARGCNKIDYLVATHPHSDHIGSMAYIVRSIDIGEIYMPKVSTNTKTFENLLEAISDKGLKIKTAEAGVSIIDEDDFDVDILGPVKIYKSDLNNCSAVIKMTYGDTSYLFLADAEVKELNQIEDDLFADVLKVGHHGSSTSSTPELLARITPQIAVISVGENNDYGHPHKETLKYLGAIGAEIYRTDEDGTITVSSNGSEIAVDVGGESIEEAY